MTAPARRSDGREPAPPAPMDELVAQALVREGLEVRAFERISAFGVGLTERHAYRVTLADGRTIKARRTLGESQARRVVEALRAVADARFPRVLSRHGPVLLEEWIEGVPLTSAAIEDRHLAEAAAVLAKVHLVEALAGVPVRETGDTAARLAATETRLQRLAGAGALDEASRTVLVSALRDHDPHRAEIGLVHLDFCPENLLIDLEGRLRVVDNEALAVDALAYDLGRSWYRSALPAGEMGAVRGRVSACRRPRRERRLDDLLAHCRRHRGRAHAARAGLARRPALRRPARAAGGGAPAVRGRPASPEDLMARRTIVFFCMSQRGHLQRMRPLISMLAASGWTAHVFTDRQFKGDVEASAGRFEDLFAPNSLDAADVASIPPPFRYVTFAGRFAHDVADRVRRLRPAIVASDSFAVIGHVVSRRLGVPHVNICAGHNVHPGRLSELLPSVPASSPSSGCLDAARRLSDELEIDLRGSVLVPLRAEPLPERLLRAARVPDPRGTAGVRTRRVLRVRRRGRPRA